MQGYETWTMTVDDNKKLEIFQTLQHLLATYYQMKIY